MSRKYKDLIGEILETSGEKDNYQGDGKGKPLPTNYMKQDILQNFQEKAMNAGFLPPWLKLQKEIFTLLDTAETESDLDSINTKIKEYNLMCPPPMQKSLISLDNLAYSKGVWR